MTPTGQKSIELLQSYFREFYFRQAKNIEAPDRISAREFGYSRFSDQAMVRHLSFENMGELMALLVREVPSDVYCSNALYKHPSGPMQEKGWIGASLIFDIDAKDLELPCAPSHSFRTCRACGNVYEYSNPIQVCTSCKSKLSETSIPCAKCTSASKSEVVRLLDFLEGDLGIPSDGVAIYFSGNNGFHFHVQNDSLASLESHARSDLAGYLLGSGIIPESLGVIKAPSGGHNIRYRQTGLSLGWRKRIAKKLAINSRDRLESLVIKNGGYVGFKKYLDSMVREMSVRIDPQVTTDVHRIFRMPGTINGKSSLTKFRCERLDDFDPFRDACVIDDKPAAIVPSIPIKIRMKGKIFSLSAESQEVPGYVACYLICKGLASAA